MDHHDFSISSLHCGVDRLCAYSPYYFDHYFTARRTGIEKTRERAEDLHATIHALNIQYGPFNLTTTISMGIAWYPAPGTTKEALMRAADMAMYVAKNTGRNRVIIYDEHDIGG